MLSKKWAVMLIALVIGSLIITACAQPKPVEVVKEVPVTKIVEVEKTVEVQKIVKETVIVEVTPTPSIAEVPVTLNRNLGTEPPTLDPALATDTTSVEVDKQLFLGLTAFDPKTAEVIPELATEWTANEEATEWTFKMRDDVHWVNYKPSTGVVELGPVTAHDVVYGVKRTCDPRTASDYAYVDYIIKGCQELNTADVEALSDEELQALVDGVGVEALDDYTVKFTLNNPAGYFPAIAGMWVNRPQPKESIESYGDRWTEPGFIISNGPYVLETWVHDDSMTLIKNPFYYDADNVQIERIEYVMIVEASTAFAMYEANELDTAGVPLDDMDRVKADPVLSKELYIAPILCTYYYGFTNTKPPVDNVLVRKALSAAIDRKTLVETVTKGGQIPANTFAPKGIFGNAALDPDIAPWALPEELGGWGYEKALAQAKEWLAEAGYPNGEGFPTITLMHNTSEGHAKIAQAIQAMWKEGLGINVNVENQEWKVYLTTLKKETPLEEMPHVWRLGWCADYPDENNWVHEVFNSNAGANRLRWDGDEWGFNQLTEQAQAETDPAKRKELYKQAEKILVDEAAAMAPIYYYTTVTVTKPWLQRDFPALGGPNIKDWKIDMAAKLAAKGM